MAVVAPPAVNSDSVFVKDIFKGKVLFCTGGGSGICKEMTRAIMYHGADAMIVGRNLERVTSSAKELSSQTRRTCIAASADVRQPKALQDAVKKCVDQFGRVDFVICGAAGNFLAPISLLSENAFRTVMEIDTIGTYNTVKATLPHLRKTHGSYIHVSATLHHRGSPLQAHVSAAKAGIDALSRVIAVEEGPHGVRSNVIAPGPIADTEGMDRLGKGGAKEAWVKSVPLQRLGSSTDVANAALFLFSEAANWITGQLLVVDGASEHTRPSAIGYPDIVVYPERIRSKL